MAAGHFVWGEIIVNKSWEKGGMGPVAVMEQKKVQYNAESFQKEGVADVAAGE